MMNAPHCRGPRGADGSWDEYDLCRFCKTPIAKVGWTMCPKAPKVARLPVVGEVWNILEHNMPIRAMVVSVNHLGDWWWGHTGACQQFYSRQEGKSQWPPKKATRVSAATPAKPKLLGIK